MPRSPIAALIRAFFTLYSRTLFVSLSLLVLIATCWAGQIQKARKPSAHAHIPVTSVSAIPKTPANLAQLMRGIMFPNSNIIYAAQGKDPAEWPAAKRPSSAINPIEGTYGKWEAIENSALVIAEAGNLLSLPGRSCSNGVPVPVSDPQWTKFVQALRDAGMQSFAAAQSKNQDKIVDASDALTTACGNCHVRYRDKPTLAERCR